MTPTERAMQTPSVYPGFWGLLERDAFRNHPAVLEAFKQSSRSFQPKGWRKVGYITATALFVLAGAGPMIGFPLLVPARINTGGGDWDYTIMLPLSASLFILTNILFTVALFEKPKRVGGQRKRHQGGRGFSIGAGLYLTVLGGLALMLGWAGGAQADFPGWQLWLVPIAGTVLLGLSHLARAALVPADEGAAEAPIPPNVHLQNTVNAIPSPERKAIRAELAEAIQVLLERQLISSATAEHALRAETGRLPAHMLRKPANQ